MLLRLLTRPEPVCQCQTSRVVDAVRYVSTSSVKSTVVIFLSLPMPQLTQPTGPAQGIRVSRIDFCLCANIGRLFLLIMGFF